MPRKIDPEKEAIDRMREAAFHPSLDEVWARDPREHTADDRAKIVAALRQERALWNAIQERRARRKQQQEPAPDAAPAEDEWDD